MPPRPFIRGKFGDGENFQAPRGFDPNAPPPYPKRDRPGEHRDALLAQLAAVKRTIEQRPDRVPGATRELIAVRPAPDSTLALGGLTSKEADVRLAAVREDSGVAILDAPSGHLAYLAEKAKAFADDKRVSAKTHLRSSEPVIAPIAEIALAGVGDRAGVRFVAARPDPEIERWFEFACRGGYRTADRTPAGRVEGETESSRAQMTQALAAVGSVIAQEFLAPERLYLFARVRAGSIEQLILSVDCIEEFDLSPPDRRAWLHLGHGRPDDIAHVVVRPPEDAAPSVVVLDTGVATRHRLLAPALLSATSAIPSDRSPEDVQGHGTEMSGVALFEDVLEVIDAGGAEAPHWLQSSRIIRADHEGEARQENHPIWPPMTRDAVLAAERLEFGERRRVFTLAVTTPLDHPPRGTLWSHAIDQLAAEEGARRLFCVSIGDSVVDRNLLEGYPLLNLEQRLEDPAQAFNAITVGAYTKKATLPPDPDLQNYRPIAPVAGVSPHSRAGMRGQAIKPDVVFEGGNVGYDGAMPNWTLETLIQPTTGHRPNQPISWMAMTSGAVANAARFAAQVWKGNEALLPETVRGLMVHSADWTHAMREQFPNIDERLQLCGYGVPDLSFAKECADERATVIVEDVMPNAVVEEVPKKKKPKRASSKQTDPKFRRKVKYFTLPVPEELLLRDLRQQVELRVTLSYLAEPHTTDRRVERGLDLAWDMQGRGETEEKFKKRVNKLQRDPSAAEEHGKSFPWDVGKQRRSRGTVQSDRWRGAASYLAGSKLIAVYPVLGWWDRRDALRLLEMPFTLIVSVLAGGIDIYTPIQQAVEIEVPV